MESIHVGQVFRHLRVGLVVEAVNDQWMVESIDKAQKPRLIHVRSLRTRVPNTFQVKDLTAVMIPVRHDQLPQAPPPSDPAMEDLLESASEAPGIAGPVITPPEEAGPEIKD